MIPTKIATVCHAAATRKRLRVRLVPPSHQWWNRLSQSNRLSKVALGAFGGFSAFPFFLPNFIFSGALFEIAAMPTPIRALTYLFPARYFTVCLQTVFMAGNVWSLLAAQSARIALIAVVFLVATIFATRPRLE